MATSGATTTTEDVLAGIDLTGKRALVTGASGGLGLETARALASRGAEVIVAAELARFERWLGSLEVLPTVASLRLRADDIVGRVLAENIGRFEDLSHADQVRVEAMARAIASRLLHEPTLRLKRAAEESDAYQQVAALRELFGLDAGTEPEGAGAEVTPLRRRADRAGD